VPAGLFRETAAWPFLGWPDFQGQQWKQCLEEARDLKRAWPGVLQGNDVHSGALALAAKDVQAAGVGGIVKLSRGDCRAWVPEMKPDLVVTNPPWGARLLAAGGPGGRERAGGPVGRDMGGRDMRGRDMGGRDMRGRDMGGRDMQQRGAAWARGGDGGGRERAAPQASETSPELSDAWSALSSFVKTQCGGATAYVLSGNPQLSQAIKMRASEKWGITVGGQETMLLQYQVRGAQAAADAAGAGAGAAAAAQ
jgi:23S rRNA G2445 N2-methylase RlmL